MSSVEWLLDQKLVDALERPLPQLTARDVWWPQLAGKAVAVVSFDDVPGGVRVVSADDWLLAAEPGRP